MREHAGPCRLKEFELHRPAGLLLHNDRTGSDAAAANQIPDANLHHVAAAELAVMARSNSARTRSRRSRSSQNLIAQTC